MYFGIIEHTALKRVYLRFSLLNQKPKLSCGDPFNYGRSLLLEDTVAAKGAFYSSTAKLKLFCSNFGATFHAFVS
jgi:hypothetical protein